MYKFLFKTTTILVHTEHYNYRPWAAISVVELQQKG